MNRKIKYSKFFLWTVVFALIFALAGCGMFAGDSQQVDPGNSTQDTGKIGLLLGTSDLNDPYYQSAWQGLQRIGSDLGYTVGYVQAKNVKDYGSALADLKQQGYGLIITLGDEAAQAVSEAAAKDPAIAYICLDAAALEKRPQNVITVTYRVEEPAFLAGYLAGKISKTAVAGFISGDNGNLAQKYHYAYKSGLRHARPSCELLKGLAATYTNKSRIKAITERMLESRADVIFCITGKSDSGIAELTDGKDTIVSVVKNHEKILEELIKAYQEQRLEFKERSVGLNQDYLMLDGLTSDSIPSEVLQKLMDLKEKIGSGQLVVPRNEEQYLKFTEN